MVIKFDKKRRRLFVIIVALLIIIGGSVRTFVLTNQRETFTLQDEQNRNQYTVDVIYDDETNRILCNQSLVYINNTKTTLDKVYLHIFKVAQLLYGSVTLARCASLPYGLVRYYH